MWRRLAETRAALGKETAAQMPPMRQPRWRPPPATPTDRSACRSAAGHTIMRERRCHATSLSAQSPGPHPRGALRGRAADLAVALSGMPDVRWIRAMYPTSTARSHCEYDAPSAEAIREHARRAGLPSTSVSETPSRSIRPCSSSCRRISPAGIRRRSTPVHRDAHKRRNGQRRRNGEARMATGTCRVARAARSRPGGGPDRKQGDREVACDPEPRLVTAPRLWRAREHRFCERAPPPSFSVVSVPPFVSVTVASAPPFGLLGLHTDEVSRVFAPLRPL